MLSRTVYATIAVLLGVVVCSSSFGGESSLTRTFQPLNGLGSGEIVIAPVMCHDWFSHSGFPTGIGLITAKNVPPTNAPKPVEDINVASASGIKLSFDETDAGKGVVRVDCTGLAIPQRFGCTDLQAVAATLECLRLVVGTGLDGMRIEALLKPSGQDSIRQLVDAFIKHPKNVEFPWKRPNI